MAANTDDDDDNVYTTDMLLSMSKRAKRKERVIIKIEPDNQEGCKGQSHHFEKWEIKNPIMSRRIQNKKCCCCQ